MKTNVKIKTKKYTEFSVLKIKQYSYGFSYIKLHNVLHKSLLGAIQTEGSTPTTTGSTTTVSTLARADRRLHRGAEPSSHQGWSCPWDGTRVDGPELLPVWKVPMGETLELKTDR